MQEVGGVLGVLSGHTAASRCVFNVQLRLLNSAPIITNWLNTRPQDTYYTGAAILCVGCSIDSAAKTAQNSIGSVERVL